MKSKETEEQTILPIKMSFVPECQDNLIEKIGISKYNELLRAVCDWSIKSTNYYSKLDYIFNKKGKEMVHELITEPSFIKMISIHKDIAKIDKEGILPLLTDCIKHLQMDFHIPYTYITKKVYDTHNKSNVVMISEANHVLPLLELIGEETGLKYDGD